MLIGGKISRTAIFPTYPWPLAEKKSLQLLPMPFGRCRNQYQTKLDLIWVGSSSLMRLYITTEGERTGRRRWSLVVFTCFAPYLGMHSVGCFTRWHPDLARHSERIRFSAFP